LVVVVRFDVGGLLSPDEGEENENRDEPEPPPREDPGVPGGRYRHDGDGAPPGTCPRPQKHPPRLGALSQPGRDPRMPNAFIRMACECARPTRAWV
jgi:hypothetical protein